MLIIGELKLNWITSVGCFMDPGDQVQRNDPITKPGPYGLKVGISLLGHPVQHVIYSTAVFFQGGTSKHRPHRGADQLG
jgi:hypothetical protein